MIKKTRNGTLCSGLKLNYSEVSWVVWLLKGSVGNMHEENSLLQNFQLLSIIVSVLLSDTSELSRASSSESAALTSSSSHSFLAFTVLSPSPNGIRFLSSFQGLITWTFRSLICCFIAVQDSFLLCDLNWSNMILL